MFRSALLILSGNAFASLLLLARNLIVARLISVEDYGIAATFAVTMAVVEMMSALGLQQQIVQARNGDDPRFQAALQAFQLIRGAISGVLLLLIAGPIAHFLRVPELAWAYRLMAVMPVLNAMVHFDIYRMNRRMVYLPSILTGAVPAFLSLLLIWPLSAVFGDWRVLLYAILAQGVLAAITSHLVAERPYRLVLDRAIMAGSLRFGLPLLANGVLLFFVFQGEKLVIGRELGMTLLAVFSMGVTLTLTPTMVAAKSTQNFFLPQLAAAAAFGRDSVQRRHFVHLAMVTVEAGLLIGTLLVLAIMACGGPVVGFLLGPKYAPLLPFLTLLAVLHALRVFKVGGSIIALAEGHTGNALVSNLFRVASLPFSWYVLTIGGDLVQVIWIAIAGETCGFAASLLLVRYRMHISLRPVALPLVVTALLLSVAALPAAMPTVPLPGWTVPVSVVALFALLILTMSDFRQYLVQRKVTKFMD